MEDSESSAAPGPKLIKGLASCNPSVRSKSLKSLLSWLPSQTLISDDLMKKLWKSLFYCMWHCDKIVNQTHLIYRLSSLIPLLSPPLSLSYLSHFLLTMRREWPGIDHLRLDKFYLLIRAFLRNLFVFLRNNKWDLRVLESCVVILEKTAFFVDDDIVDDKGLGNGVTFHVVSVFCDEIKAFLPLSVEVLKLVFRPFVAVMGRSENKVLLGKVRNHVFDCLIKNAKDLLSVKKLEEEIDEKDERVLFGTVAFVMGFSSMFYELGSSPGCIQGNRKVVFSLHEEFSRLEKEKSSLGIDVSLPEVIEGLNDEEVSQFIPINGEKMECESKAKSSKDKKSKKKKKKKNGLIDQAGPSRSESNGDVEMINSINENTDAEIEDNVEEIVLNETAISNLQKQFEKIAAESGLDGGDGVSALDSSPTKVQVNGKMKKRKRSKSAVEAANDTSAAEEETMSKTEDKSVKRVKFSMKNNLVWKPHSPLPPQSLRIPPSVTPRGSALKKGLSPGPIRDTSQDSKKAKKKKASPLKKARKVKTVKRVKKAKSLSA